LKRTIVFDLDDTLYSEQDYVLSGKRAVVAAISDCFNVDIGAEFLYYDGDFLDRVCALADLPYAVKETLLWVYRTHIPDISLRPGVTSLLGELRSRGDAICILTDGRAITQRLKIRALQIDVDSIYVSEQLGAKKPDAIGYEKITTDFPADNYVYVGDNPQKDFIAPKRMGWQTFGFVADGKSIHRYDLGTIDATAMPDKWFADFSDLAKLLEVVDEKSQG